jgi:hypothetical protein
MLISESQQTLLEIVKRRVGFSLEIFFFEHELSVHERQESG